MANILIAYPSHADVCTPTGGAWRPTLPAANLLSEHLDEVARTVDASLASTQLTCDLGKPRSVRVVALCGNNLSPDARYRVTACAAADFAVLEYDSGWLSVWPPVYLPEQREWEEDNWWDGLITSEDFVNYPRNLIHVAAQTEWARYWRIELSDTANPDGYVQAARLYIATGFQPSKNVSYGASLGVTDLSSIQQMDNGGEVSRQRARRRVLSASLDWLTDDEAMVQVLELSLRAGSARQLLVLRDPGDLMHRHRNAFLARMQRTDPIRNPYHATHAWAAEFLEIV